MPEAGLEPARGKAPWDFKSHVSTNSTTPACGQIVGEGLPSRNTVETGWGGFLLPDFQFLVAAQGLVQDAGRNLIVVIELHGVGRPSLGE